MNAKEFKEIRNRISALTPAQKRRLTADLQESARGEELPEQVRQREAELDRLRICRHCGAKGVVRHGKSAGLRRFRCRSASCGRTFHALTGTKLAGLRHKSKWSMFEACMQERLTLHQSAERCGIAYRTAFLWRHRFLDKERKESRLKGIVEVDESYFLESCKGDRSLQERRLPRERGGNRGRRGLGSEQRPVLTAVSRGGPTHAEALPSTAVADIAPAMSEWLSEDCAVVTDGHPSYQAASRSLSLRLETVCVSRRELRRGIWHLNTVNQRHATMKRWLNHHHRGVSTRYLDHYMSWLMKSEFRVERSIQADFLSPHLASYAVHN